MKCHTTNHIVTRWSYTKFKSSGEGSCRQDFQQKQMLAPNFLNFFSMH